MTSLSPAPGATSPAMDQPVRSSARRHVVIIGGGISGLSAAYEIQKLAAGSRVPFDCTVLESADRWGGKVLTEQVKSVGDRPFIVEAGPDSFQTQAPWAVQLARELGLGDRLLGANDRQRQVYVLRHGKPVVMPDGILLIVPTRFAPFALSPLITPWGKLRMGMDLLIPRKRDEADETLAEFVQRRLGREALDRIADPLMSGIYNADADKQSVLATLPRLRQLEREHGSLVRGMLASRTRATGGIAQLPGSGGASAFMSLQGGTQELIDALVSALGGNVLLNRRVVSIEQRAHGGYLVTTSAGDRLEADAVLVTTSAPVAAGLVRPIAPVAADLLEAIRHVSTGTISLAFRESDIGKPLKGYGVLVPKSENRPINAITVSSTKFDHRAPAGYALLRIFFGGSHSPESMSLDDERLLEMVRRELRLILGIVADPIFHRIYRWWHANPQYGLGHLDAIARIEANLPPSLFLAGNAFRGVGMPDCIHHAQEKARVLVASLSQRDSPA